jgi:hypothetical protein
MLIFDRYGPLLGPAELADVTGYATGTIENMIARGDFEIPTAKRGRRTVAHYMDVAEWIDRMRLSAASSPPRLGQAERIAATSPISDAR